MASRNDIKRAAKAYVLRLMALGMTRAQAKAKCISFWPVDDAELEEPDQVQPARDDESVNG